MGLVTKTGKVLVLSFLFKPLLHCEFFSLFFFFFFSSLLVPFYSLCCIINIENLNILICLF